MKSFSGDPLMHPAESLHDFRYAKISVAELVKSFGSAPDASSRKSARLPLQTQWALTDVGDFRQNSSNAR
jgi:hypothetical protein